jgi:predicted ATPase
VQVQESSMKIKSIEMKNFLSFSDTDKINFKDGLNLVVGPNESGKTNIFRAVTFLWDLINLKHEHISSYARPYFRNNEYLRPLVLSVGLSLETQEIEVLCDFIKAVQLIEIIPTESETETQLLKSIVLAFSDKVSRNAFEDITLEVTVQNEDIYEQSLIIRIKGISANNQFFIYPYGEGVLITIANRNPRAYRPFHFQDLLRQDWEEKNQELNNNFHRSGEIPNLEDSVAPDFADILSKVDSTRIIVIPRIRLQLKDLYEKIPQLRHVSRYSKSRGIGKDEFSLLDLIYAIYSASIVRTSNLNIRTKNFNESEDGLGHNYKYSHEIAHDELPLFLFQLINSDDPVKRNRYRDIQNCFRTLTRREFDIIIRSQHISTPQYEVTTLSPGDLILENEAIKLIGVRQKETRKYEYNPALVIIKDGLVVPIEFAAAGIYEALYIITILLGSEAKIVLLDEPAVSLHPNWQKQIFEIIKNRCSSGIQIILITHSPFLINADDPDNIWRFYAEGEVTRIVHVGKAIIGLDEKETIKIKQSLNNSDIRPLLFSKGIIFVEGPSDKIVIEKTDAALSLQEKGPKISENEWNVIAIGSKYDLRHFVYLAKMLKINYISIMDNDALMICNRKMVMNGVLRETSPIFLALSELNDLKQTDMTLRTRLKDLKHHLDLLN